MFTAIAWWSLVASIAAHRAPTPARGPQRSKPLTGPRQFVMLPILARRTPDAIRDQMKRREFISLLGSTAAWPLAARAQQSDRVKHIGVLSVGTFPLLKEYLAAFRSGLELAGWSDGRNAQIDVRFDTPEQVHVRAQELVALQPDVILACTTPAALAVQHASRTIPIVFVAVSDPIGAGLVANLARPGANLTGVFSFEDTITGKWLAMLKEIAPHLERVALVANPKTSPYDYYLRAARMIAPSLAIEIVPKPIESADDIEQTIASLARMTNCGLVITPDTTTLTHLDLVVVLSAQHRVAAVYYDKRFVSGGGLLSYGIDFAAHYRQAAAYVDRILRGAKPADLPVQAPTKFETALNLKTANALGLAVPPGLLVAADEVIE
jgi:putative ABC transport system substrate-binding protein